MKTGIFGYMSSFWKLAEQEAFTTSETALYFFLLDRANRQKWRMPICCSTEIVRFYLSTSKQNVIKAREGLRARKLIDFTPGKGNRSFPQYFLLTLDASQLSDELSDELTLYKNKEKNKEDFDVDDDNAREANWSFEGMQNRLLADEEWHQNVADLLSSQGIKDIPAGGIKLLLKEFLSYIKTACIEEKDEKDCRRHFVNWVTKLLSKQSSIRNSSYEYLYRLQNEFASGERGVASKSTYFDAF